MATEDNCYINMPDGMTPPVGYTLAWDNLTLSVRAKNQETKSVENKTILNNVSGVALPGEFLVIMGPSGAGKSSLLDCISGRNHSAKGKITVNGKPWTISVKRLTSYVMQDDLFYGTITVYEHLMFQAKLKLGNSTTYEQRAQRVQTVMEELGLTKCKDSLIGDARIRGISGGERKRLSFATEILTNPSILFVDEPTSGLDSATAETVTQQLVQLARGGRTIIATIHQPSADLFALFDKLYLLSDGVTVYHGPTADSVEYFANLGYKCPQFQNPADYYMKQLVILDKNLDTEGVERVQMLKNVWGTHSKNQLKEVNTDTKSLNENESHETASSKKTSVGFSGQIIVLAHRNILRLFRDKMSFAMLTALSIFVSVLLGLIYFNTELTQTGVQNLTGALFFFSVQQTFMTANNMLLTIPLELPIVNREYQNGLYHLFSWYAAKNVSEIPMQIFIPIIFFTPVYFLMNLHQGFKVWLYMQLILMLLNSCAVGFAYFVSCIVRRAEIAPIAGIAIMLPFLLLGGLLINTNDIPIYFKPIEYLSPVKYGFNAIMQVYFDSVGDIPCDAQICVARNGRQVLANYSLDTDVPTVGENALLLVAINLGFRVCGFIILYFSMRNKNDNREVENDLDNEVSTENNLEDQENSNLNMS